jgi:O-antigen polymerase
MKIITHKLLLHFANAISLGILSYSLVLLPVLYQRDLTQDILSYRFINGSSAITLLFLFVTLYHIINKPSLKILNKITRVDILLLIFFIYTLISHFFIAGEKEISVKLFNLCILAMLYIVIRMMLKNLKKTILWLLLMSGIIQGIYGLLQLYGFYPSNHGLFNLTGGFFNPGPYAGYLCGIASMTFALYINRKKQDITIDNKVSLITHKLLNRVIITINRFLKLYKVRAGINISNEDEFHRKLIVFLKNIRFNYIPFLCLISILLVIPASRSRASWVSIVVVFSFILLRKYNPVLALKRLPWQQWQKSLIVSFALIILLSGVFGVYYFKKDSADGRLVIWKSTVELIKEQPVFGIGFGKYESRYMDYQANYLKDAPDTEILLAGETNLAYNSLLKQMAEKGILAFILISLILALILFSKTSETHRTYSLAIKAGIAGIVIFSMFSYPEQIFSIQVQFVCLLALISSMMKPVIVKDGLSVYSYKKVILIKFAIAIFAITTGTFSWIYLNKLHTAYTTWQEGDDLYTFSIYEEAAEEYKTAYPVLKNHGVYLLNYGKALSLAGKHMDAIEILQKTKNYLNNTILYTALGDSYKAIGNYLEAEAAYKKAQHILPGRFYPGYLLAKLYQETGETRKAKTVANEILRKEVKVPSTAIEEIKMEMKNILNGNVGTD